MPLIDSDRFINKVIHDQNVYDLSQRAADLKDYTLVTSSRAVASWSNK